MKVQKVKIENFKCLDRQDVDLNGRNIIAMGGNCKGKTSLIDAIFGAMPKKPLKEGEKKGKVSIDVGEYVCEFTFSEKNEKPKLNIFDSTGKPQSSPATLFKQLFGSERFDIEKFLSMSDNDKAQYVKNLIGIDWTDADNRHKELYENRRFLNRKLKELDAKNESIKIDPNLKKLDTSIISEKLKKAEETNSQINGIESGLSSRLSDVESKKKQIEALQAEVSKMQTEISKAEKWLNENKKIDTSSIHEEMEAAIETNERVNTQEIFLKSRNEAVETGKQIDEIESEMTEIRAKQKEELEAANMPVEGMTFEDNKLYLNGLPFDSGQINTAKKIICGLKLSLHNAGEIKIDRFDGSLLDKDSMEEVQQWAKENDVQLFIELVDRENSDLKIEILEK